MDKQKLEQHKKFADFAITPFYQNEFKAFLEEIQQQEYEILDKEPMIEFDSIKRDLVLYAMKRVIRRIKNRIDKASDVVAKEMKKQSELNIKTKKL